MENKNKSSFRRSSGSSFRSSSSSSSFRGSRSGGFGGGNRGGRSTPRPFDPKRTFKSDSIDSRLFINKATVKDVEVYEAKHNFKDFNISEKILNNIEAMGITKPSPIQDQSIPVIMSGVDVIGIAATGTGKTLAFTVPMIKNLETNYKEKVMVLCPTRELAEQVEGAFRRLSKGMKLYSFPIVGGSPIMKQIHELKNGLDFVVGTPGRVKDLIERGKINMGEFKYIILDEADRMLDMGFIGDMKLILGMMPKEKQGLFFSATFSPDIKRLVGDFLQNPATIAIKSRDTSTSVEQDIIKYKGRDDKLNKLYELLTGNDLSKVLIFRETKRDTDELARELRKLRMQIMLHKAY